MSTQHVTHEILIPGLPGDGFTAPEAAQVRADVDSHDVAITRIDPGVAGSFGQTLRNGPDGPVWTRDVISADWFSKPRDAVDAAGPNGAVRFSPGVVYSYVDPIELQSYQHLIMNGAELRPTGDAGFMAKTYGTARTEGVKLEGGILQGGHQAPIGIDFRGFVDSEISSMRIRGHRSFGVWFGGDNDHGGWTNGIRYTRIHDTVGDTTYPGHSEPAGIYFQGKTAGGTGAINANNIAVDHCVIQTHAALGIYCKEGQANTFMSNDIGYVVGGIPGHWGMKFGIDGDYNMSVRDRFETSGGAILIEGARENIFTGFAVTAFSAGYTGWTVEVLNGAYNMFYPTAVHANGQVSWIRFATGVGNEGHWRGQTVVTSDLDPAVAYGIGVNVQPRFQYNGRGTMQWGQGDAAPDVQLDRPGANRLRLAAGDTFETDVNKLGSRWYWTDSTGKLRSHTSAPSSSTSTSEGTIVGSQT